MSTHNHSPVLSVLVSLLVGVAAAPHTAQGALDAPSLGLDATGSGKQRLVITAGESGAPSGFTVLWAELSQFPGQWYPQGSPGQRQAYFYGRPTLNVFEGESPTFKLAPGATISVEIGDLWDESGVSTMSPGELRAGTEYVFCVYANSSVGPSSGLSPTLGESTLPPLDCTYTIGYWKTHPDAWPVTDLDLGNVNYGRVQLLWILNQPTRGNGLISLAHQLIASKLDVANGADPTAVLDVISEADALIGDLVVPPVGSGYLDPASTSPLTQRLDDYNNGVTGPGHCDETGACCLPDSTCLTLSHASCLLQGGNYIGDGTTCDPDPCLPPPPPTGACCFHPGGDCATLTELECMARGGSYEGDGVACSSGLCMPSATKMSTWGTLKHQYR